MTIPLRLSAALCFLLFVLTRTHAQVSSSIASITPDEATANTPVILRAELRQAELINRVFLVYRSFGQSQYEQTDMDISGSSASAVVPARVVAPPFLEYYIVLARHDGTLETFPVSETPDPFTSPPLTTLRLLVRAADEAPQVLFLSPDPTEVLTAEDVVIAVSLLRADSAVAVHSTQILLDGADLTSMAVLTGDLLVLSPKNAGIDLAPGAHTVTVKVFDHDGVLYRSAAHQFTVRGETGFRYTEPILPDWRTTSTFMLEMRHEQVGDAGTWYNRGSLDFSARKDTWRLLSSIFLTSDEQSDRQPQNRFYVAAESPWIAVGLGDCYPVFPNLILSGKRIRGLNGGLHLGFFNIDVAAGETVRPIDGALLDSFPADSLPAEQNRNPSAAYARIDSTTWGSFRYGTFEQNLLAVRPSFGSGQTIQFGLTWLSAKDHIGSITYGTRPQENIVLGSDFVLRLDGGSILFTGQAAFSAYNGDISSGTFSDEYIDSVFSNPEDVKKAKDILSRFITVNENLRPLTFPTRSTLAWEASLALNYFENSLRVGYIFRGSDFTSFGQTYIRRDIQGFNILDRIRLIGNRLMLTAGYERLHDNTVNQKLATTVFNTVNTAVSYYAGTGLPNVTIGYTLYDNSNGLSPSGPDSASEINDRTNRIYGQIGQDFEGWAHHTGTLTLSTSRRKDYSLRMADTRNIHASLALTTRYDIPLHTMLDLSLDMNELPAVGGIPGSSSTLNYTTITLYGRYTAVENLLNLFATIAPSFGDVERTTFDLGAEYYLERTLALVGQFSYFRNRGSLNDNVVSVRLRYDI